MITQISCDLRIGLGDQVVKVTGEDSRLTADFDSLRALRRFQKTVPADLTSLPAGFPEQAVAGLVVFVVLKGRRIATVRTEGRELNIQRHWGAILSSLLPW